MLRSTAWSHDATIRFSMHPCERLPWMPTGCTRPDAAHDAAQYYWLFPNMMLNVYFGQLQTNLVVPRGVDHTTVVFEWFALEQSVDPESDEWARRVAFSEMVQEEDREICEAVHHNLHSRVYDRGRYAPRFEQGVHHFHALLHEFLS